MNQFYFPEIKKHIFDRQSRIIATGSAFPENVVTNADIISKYNHSVTDIVIQKTIGVKERRVASDDSADSDLLCKAAIACLAKAGIRPEQLSKLIVNKFIGDKVLPMTASLLQKKLNCPDAIHSFDVDGGANSFLQALDLASAAINSGDSYILIVSGGINNCLASRTDPRTAFLFGDGAGAVLLGPSDKQHILSSYFFSNYEFADLFTGFTHCKNIPSDIHETKNYEILYDQYHAGNWKVAEDFIIQALKVTAEKMLDATGLTFNDIVLVSFSAAAWREIAARSPPRISTYSSPALIRLSPSSVACIKPLHAAEISVHGIPFLMPSRSRTRNDVAGIA